MQTSVKLQDPFSYSIWPIIIFFVILLIVFIVWLNNKRKQNVSSELKIKEPSKESLETIKKKYLKKIDFVEEKLKNNKIALRGAYQELSSIIRLFAFEVTGIKVQNYTLRDIEKINMPSLSELIKEYYAPEFAEISKGNIESSLEKTRKVIERWN